MYALSAQDMTTLGRMGDQPRHMYTKFYHDPENARVHAENEYKDLIYQGAIKSGESDRVAIAKSEDLFEKKFSWSKTKSGWTTGDMGDRMYSIYEVKVEDG